ncbi:MAG: hypothetical protein KKB50_11405 [Planctomycetes bacterium]|nr:hypothetical protein [Planctomycetota bacterium]
MTGRMTRMCRVARRLPPAAAVLLCLMNPPVALAQLSQTSAWPKFQRDLQNSGAVPVAGIVTDAHVRWYVRLSDPISTESHATPVLSPDNKRLYVGGPASRLSAVDVSDGTVAWTLTLGDGTGHIFQTAALAADGSLFVGSWDSQVPYDGFCKVRDNGGSATLVWTYPFRRALGSPTITADGLIVVGGQHATDGWRYYALRDLGDTVELAWSAGHLSDPGDPSSTGNIGSSPALSPDGLWLYGGSDQNRTFWQIDTQTGAERARLQVSNYIWASAPVVNDAGYAFIGDGGDGQLYAFGLDANDTATLCDAPLPLSAGHLNGGAGALRRFGDGRQRIYVPANGFGGTSAQLIAIEFDPDAPPSEPALVEAWSSRASLGGSAWAFPAAVVTRDGAIYALGPANHRLYAYRDIDTASSTLWWLALSAITPVDGWEPGNESGPQGVIVGPDGTIYWNAVDGYLYAIQGWLTGDTDGDGRTTGGDLTWLKTAVLARKRYEQLFPEIDVDTVADFNGDGVTDAADLFSFAAQLGTP